MRQTAVFAFILTSDGMNFLEELVIEDPAQQRRGADTKRKRRECDRDHAVTSELLFGKVRATVGHEFWHAVGEEIFVNGDCRRVYTAHVAATSGVFAKRSSIATHTHCRKKHKSHKTFFVLFVPFCG